MLRRTFLTGFALAGCGRAAVKGSAAGTPAAPASQSYDLSVSPQGEAYLIWIETTADEGADRYALRLSRLDDGEWLPAQTIATGGDDWFVNFADHASIAAGPGGRLTASWSYRPPAAAGSKWGLATRIVFSPDRGKTWRRVTDLGADNTADYSGFIGFSAGDFGFRAAYLAPLAKGSEQHDAAHVKTLRFADFSLKGKLLRDERVDADVCTCCPLASAETAAGPVVVYRDHEAGEIRDISIVRRVGNGWTKPRPVHRDGWKINGCPANGAVIQAEGRRVAAAWFTAADEKPHVRLALSDDCGESFGRPIDIDAGHAAGWADAAIFPDGRTAVSWLEKRPQEPGLGDVMLRLVERDGTAGPPRVIGEATSGRATGIPQMVRVGDKLLLAWRHDGQVRTRLVRAK